MTAEPRPYPAGVPLRTRILAALSVFLLMTFLGATPAQAAIPPCALRWICLYQNATGSPNALVSSFVQTIPATKCQNVSVAGYPINYFDNETPYVWYGFRTTTCKGKTVQFMPRAGRALSSFGSGWCCGSLHGVYRTTRRS